MIARDQDALAYEALEAGWEGFSGTVVYREPASPEGVPAEYVMQPYDVKLSYLGKPWCTVPLEVGHNERGDADKREWVELADAVELLGQLGFPSPGKAPPMPLTHQIAQKPYGLTGPGGRARDLIDLQLIVMRSDIDLCETRAVCERLFDHRRMQAWPPIVAAPSGWSEMYAAQAKGLAVLPDVESAVEWTNELIARIEKAYA